MRVMPDDMQPQLIPSIYPSLEAAKPITVMEQVCRDMAPHKYNKMVPKPTAPPKSPTEEIRRSGWQDFVHSELEQKPVKVPGDEDVWTELIQLHAPTHPVIVQDDDSEKKDPSKKQPIQLL